VLRILFDEEDVFYDVELWHGAVEGRIHEANYGLWDELRDLAEAGIPFEGSHNSGGSYDGAVFVSDGNEYANCCTCLDMGGPVALVNSDGTVDFAMKREADLYWRLRPLAEVLLYPDYCPKCGKCRDVHEADGACPQPVYAYGTVGRESRVKA
jgi:hypothetical protein